MKASDVRRLNNEFAMCLGRVDGDRPKFKWVRATDLYYYMDDRATSHKTDSGIVLLGPRYTRHSYGAIYGDVWMIAMWRPPMPREQWERTAGRAFPYNHGGDYYPIDGTELPLGMNPDAEITRMAIRKIAEELEKGDPGSERSLLANVREKKDKAKRAEDAAFKQNSDIFDDSLPAFDGRPFVSVL